MSAPLRILHLFSNWKWTGPAEPAVLLAAEQMRRGHEVTFACGRAARGQECQVAQEARARGVIPRDGLRLRKHRDVAANLIDSRRLQSWLREARYDMVVTHQPNDHDLGASAVRRAGARSTVVRIYYGGEMPEMDRRNRRLFGHQTDGLVVFGSSLAEEFPRRFDIPVDRVVRSDPPVDLGRFDPGRTLPSLRGEFGFDGNEVVVGVVARIQKHRRFELLFEAIQLALEQADDLRLLIVGRGTHEEALAHGPAREDALRGRVVIAGYRRGDDYVATLGALDAKIFLVPGTDGTCRAAREALVMGVPVVATKRGLLPEIVEDGVTGLLIDEDAASLAAALVRLARPDGFRARLGSRAMSSARRRFSPDRVADAVEGFVPAPR